MEKAPQRLAAFVPGAIWLVQYPVRYAGARFFARMTIMRLSDGRLILHSPCAIDPALKAEIDALGPVAYLVAPGNFHHLHMAAARAAYPEAEALICPGVARKNPALSDATPLGDTPPAGWNGEIAQVLVDSNRIIREVVFLHRASRTLIVTDLIELIGDETQGVDRVLKFWWKAVTFMWNKPRPAPEYTLGWRDKRAAARSLRRILDWEFDKIVLAHGDLVTEHAKAVAQGAWARVLRHWPAGRNPRGFRAIFRRGK